MKKLSCIIISVILIFTACSFSLDTFAQDDIEPKMFFADSGEFGTDNRMIDEDGNLMPKTSAISTGKKSAKSRSAKNIPTSYDARNAGVVTSVKSQGSTGCCWAFSTMSALESYAVSEGYATASQVNFSEAHLAWFSYTATSNQDERFYGDYHTISASPYLYGGNWRIATAAFSNLAGIADESDFPFYSGITGMGNYDESDRLNHGSGYILDGAIELSSDVEIKNWIMDHGACTASILYDENYETNSSYYYNQPFDHETDSTNHMITVVGWDDNYSASNFGIVPPSDGAWLIKDSWGTWNHNQGYYWLSYEDTAFYNAVGYSLRQDSDIYNNYSYNGIDYDSSFWFGNQNTTTANIFTADGYEKVKSVSFYTIQENQNVTIQIYNAVSDGNPVSGTLVLTETVSESNTGYHTYDLETPVNIYPGMKFSVVLSVANQDGTRGYIPCEYNYNGYTFCTYSVHSGESFLQSGSRWYDVIDYNSQKGYSIGNFCISVKTECNHPYETVTTAPTCVNDGSVRNTCPQCGRSAVVEVLPATGAHDWSEWSEYQETDSNYLLSTSYCETCGQVRSKKLLLGNNTVTLGDLLQRIFERIFAAFGLEFRKN